MNRTASTLALLLLAAAGLGWWLVPEPAPQPRIVQARRDSWQLPALPRRVDSSTAAAMLLDAGLWGASAENKNAAPPEKTPDPRWRIAAVFGRAAERGVLVTFVDESRQPQRLRVGDALPSGHRIVSIGEREICIRIDKKNYRLGVESRDP